MVLGGTVFHDSILRFTEKVMVHSFLIHVLMALYGIPVHLMHHLTEQNFNFRPQKDGRPIGSTMTKNILIPV